MDAPLVQVERVSRRYGARAVLDSVSFAAHEGEVLALLGANGAGKTTLLKCLLGVIAFEGDVRIAGLPVATRGKDARRLIGYVPQLPSLPEDDRCEEALAFVAELRGAPPREIDRVLETVQLGAQRRQRIGELSGGMRQRLATAAALLGDPRLLLLDEPTASLDAESRAEFEALLARLRGAGKTVLLSTHALDRLEGMVTRALVLHEGALAFDGTFAELTKRAGGRRYVININGHQPDAILRALGELGVGSDRVERAPTTWADVARAIAPRRDREQQP